jgi:hypothetical protein
MPVGMKYCMKTKMKHSMGGTKMYLLRFGMKQVPVLYPPRVIPYGIHGMEGGFHEMSDGFHGISDGFHTISRWIPWNGRWIPWNGRWIPYLFQMDSIPFPGWSPYGIHVISSWNHNFTLVPHHFQSGFHMDSIWNQLKYI